MNIAWHTQIIIICILLISLNILADPKPNGGAECINNFECGGINAGTCSNMTNGTGNCLCPACLGNPDCSYVRKSRIFTGGMNLLFLVGIGGIGDAILGNSGYCIGQAIWMEFLLVVYIIGCVSLCVCRERFNSKEYLNVEVGRVVYLLIIVGGIIFCIVRTVYIYQGITADGWGYDTC